MAVVILGVVVVVVKAAGCQNSWRALANKRAMMTIDDAVAVPWLSVACSGCLVVSCDRDRDSPVWGI